MGTSSQSEMRSLARVGLAALWTNTTTDGSIDARMSHRVIACVFTREKDYGEMVTLFELVDHRSREEHTHYC